MQFFSLQFDNICSYDGIDTWEYSKSKEYIIYINRNRSMDGLESIVRLNISTTEIIYTNKKIFKCNLNFLFCHTALYEISLVYPITR